MLLSTPPCLLCNVKYLFEIRPRYRFGAIFSSHVNHESMNSFFHEAKEVIYYWLLCCYSSLGATNLRIGLLTCPNCFVFRRESRSQQVLSKAETVVVFAGRCDFSRSSFNFTYLPACRDGELRPFSPSPWCDFDLRFVEKERERRRNTHVTFYRRKNLHLCSQQSSKEEDNIKGAPPRPICQRYFPGIYFGLFMRSHFSAKK